MSARSFILETLRLPWKQRVDVEIGPVRINASSWGNVADLIRANEIRVSEQPFQRSPAAYAYATNTLHFVTDELRVHGESLMRAIVMHEAVHAMQDRLRARTSLGVTEAVALVGHMAWLTAYETGRLGISIETYTDYVTALPNGDQKAFDVVKNYQLLGRSVRLTEGHLAPVLRVLRSDPRIGGRHFDRTAGHDGVCVACR